MDNRNGKMLVSNMYNNKTSYKGSDIKEMTLNRIRKLHSGYVKEFYTKYFGDTGKYRVNLNHFYFINIDKKGTLFLTRDHNKK